MEPMLVIEGTTLRRVGWKISGPQVTAGWSRPCSGAVGNASNRTLTS
jgi:hypothetical protein